jgi:hypothetical protein
MVTPKFVTKSRIAVPPNTAVHSLVTAPQVQVLETGVGPAMLIDKFKAYYKSAIVLVGAVLAILNQVSPLGAFLPATARGWLTTAIAVLTVVSAFLGERDVLTRTTPCLAHTSHWRTS